MKLYYKDKGGEILEGDLVKTVMYNKDKIYKVEGLNTGSCYIIDIDTFSEGYKNIPAEYLIFVDRDFYDPDHF
jgi:hypothetical protein